jgi:C-terminal processing protease CtpA/Prc
MDLTKEQRESILTKIQTLVAERYYDPAFDNAAWQGIVARHRSPIVDAPSTLDFEKAIDSMLADMPHKALGLLAPQTPISPRNVINASFSVEPFSKGLRWVFQDVLPEGIAAKGGIRPGDTLLTIDGAPAIPLSETSIDPPFETHEKILVTYARGVSSKEVTVQLDRTFLTDKSRKKPSGLTVGSQTGDIGYLRVTHFPGRIGIDFANEVDAIFRGRLASSDKLIIDLRGNPGGGIGGQSLMSYLTPDKLPVGYSRSRKMALGHKDPSELPVFAKIPRSKVALPFLAVKFYRKPSVYVHTEGLGKRSHRGHKVILVNQHTGGSAEILTQFAQENQLATIIGSKTMGRVISRIAGKLGLGYRLGLPVAAYISGKGTIIDGKGITPDVEVPWSYMDALEKQDNQLAAAVHFLQKRG